MKNLFILDGASGTGKSDLMRYLIREKHDKVGVIITKTTRNKRAEEYINDFILDLEFIKEEEFDNLKKSDELFYHYGYRDYQYGFFKSELEEKFRSFNNVVVIIRHNDFPKILKKDFPDVRVIVVYIYTDKVEVKKRLWKLKYTNEQIKYRIKSSKLALNNYLNNFKNYDRVIINNSDVHQYENLIDQLINIYNKDKSDEINISYRAQFPLIKQLQGHKKGIMKIFENYPYEKNVFLMMRYRKYNKHLSQRIENLINNSGFKCVRADMKDWNITSDVYNPIAVVYACKYGIALFDKPEIDQPEGEDDAKNQFNPNVAYELGMMQLQGKECLIFKHTSLVKLRFFDIMKDLYCEYTHPDDLDAQINNWINTKLKSNE